MSKVELESFLKSFILFFSSLGLLTTALFYINYTKEVQTLDEKLFSQMRVCSFDLKCEQFSIDFIEQKEQKLYTLYKNEDGLSSYYPIPNSQKYIMFLHFDKNRYILETNKLIKSALWNYFKILGIVFLLSILFSFYALYPLKNALLLTQEFIKDILHDFNTPLASLRLNISMLKREIGGNEKINRIEQSIENILSLQEHLRSYLHNHTLQKEQFDLKILLQEKLSLLEKNHPNLHFEIDVKSTTLLANKKAFSRIIDNILNNAVKYNTKNGSVMLFFDDENQTLNISDTGKGIKNPKKIFDRFYKEQDRGIGIGLHIVKKLSEELSIKVKVNSELHQGTTFTLYLGKLILH